MFTKRELIRIIYRDIEGLLPEYKIQRMINKMLLVQKNDFQTKVIEMLPFKVDPVRSNLYQIVYN